MRNRKAWASVAACAALACARVACAGASSVPDDGVVLRPMYLDDATQPATAPSTEPASQPTAATNAPSTNPAATPPKPLMQLLDQTPIGTALTNANITLGGYIEGGYTISNQHVPASGGHMIALRVFDTRNNHPVLDQADFSIDRPVDYGKAATNHTIDIGGHIDLIEGWDSGLIHSSGLFDNPNVAGVRTGYYPSRSHPEYQFDITQAYIDFALPVGSGMRIRVGKFVTLLGYEVINPTTNPLYSHSYEFGFAIPFTQTGVIGEYQISPDFTIDAGITRGWNQTFKDNNGDPDFLGAVTFTPQESDELKKWKFIVNLSEGPQGTHDNHDWWTVVDAQAIYTTPDLWNKGDQLTLAADVDYGDAPHAAGVKGAAQWYAIALYGSYKINSYVTLNSRGEYYGDSKGFTLGGVGVQNVYEVTLGTAISPFPDDVILSNFVIRPEVRADYSNKRFFDAGRDYFQATFGIDAYFVY